MQYDTHYTCQICTKIIHIYYTYSAVHTLRFRNVPSRRIQNKNEQGKSPWLCVFLGVLEGGSGWNLNKHSGPTLCVKVNRCLQEASGISDRQFCDLVHGQVTQSTNTGDLQRNTWSFKRELKCGGWVGCGGVRANGDHSCPGDHRHSPQGVRG